MVKSVYAQFDRLSRRRIIRMPLDMLAAVLGVAAASAGLARLPMPRILPTPSRRFRVGKPQDFPAGTERYFEQERVLLRADGRGLSALSMVCTHLGCTVGKNGDGGFLCPCHGSRYRDDGSVISGPAPRRLRAFEIVADPSGWLIVDAAREVPASTRYRV